MLNKEKATLAVYGIQDRDDYPFSMYVHDHNVALMHGGKVEKFIQLERITRRKRDNQLHIHLSDLMREMKMAGSNNFDLVFVDNVVGRSFISARGNIRFEAPLNEDLSTGVERGRCWWFDREHEAYVLNHELAHVFTCLPFCGSFKDDSLLVHFDGGASLSNFSAWTYKDNNIESIEYHWDLKLLTTMYNANALVFGIIGAKLHDQNSVPGKMMGYASFGTYREDLEAWLRKHNWFEDCWGKRSVFFNAARDEMGWEGRYFDLKDPFLQDIVATMQGVFERELIARLEMLQKKTGCKNLYLTGGCALNIVANTAIIDQGIFDNVFIPPCTEDSGLALGAAAFVEWMKHREVALHDPYLNNHGLEDAKVEYTSEDLQEVAQRLVRGEVLAVCNGLGEAGPRALGNRSIIALANSAKLARKVSVTHKGREWYRPVAPILLEKNACLFAGRDTLHPLSKYMLLDFKVLDKYKSELAGVVHVDGTSRMQVLFDRCDNPYMFDLLSLLHEKYNIRALINTSFNKRGEPIVHTPENAIDSARNLGLQGVVVNGKLTVVER